MNSSTALPLALHQANMDLQARLAELAQAGGQHWLEFGQRLVSDGIVESAAGFQDILRTQDWQRLASLPADAFWRQLQHRFGDQQAATQLAVAAQASFARGLQEALQEWQHDTVAALDQAGLSVPALDPSWQALFEGWQPVLPAASFAAGPEPSRAAAKQAAQEKPATPKAAARKSAAVRKTPPAKKAAKKAAKKTAKVPVAKKAAAKKATQKPAKAPARKPATKAGARR